MLNQQWYNPLKVYAEVHQEDLPTMKNETQDLKISQELKPQHKVIVSETGEVVLKPDIANVSISYKSIKETVEAVKHSTQRRIDYIIQSLRNNGLKDSHYTIHKSLERIGENFQMTIEICIEFHDFKVCEDVCNFLVEKLDETVILSKPVFSYSPGKLEALRRQACVSAVKNARSKAEAITHFVNQKIASTIEIKEEEITEVVGITSSDRNVTELGIKGRIDAATVTVTAKISATFEIEPKCKKKHK